MKRIIVLLLALLCLASLLLCVSCQNTPDEPDTPDDPGKTDDPADGDGTFWLLPDGTPRYTVIRSDFATKAVSNGAVEVRKALSTMLGVELSIDVDWVQRGTDMETTREKWEILVGAVDRPESKEALAALEKNTWQIKVVDRKILIFGATDRATLLAVDYFINHYVADAGLVANELCYVGTYSPDPREAVLEDKSTGKSKPRLIETKYATEDVVIADIVPTEDGYAVDPSGATDSTKGIQKALDDCSRNGGGTVYLPAGTYVVSNSINIPAFVTLRGDWQDPDVGTEYGTIIHVWTDPADSHGTGLFMLGGSGGVLGLTIYYENQSLDNIQKYPFTFYTNGQGNNYMLSTIKNCTVINGYRGIGACCEGTAAHEQLTVENFKGSFLLCGTEVYNQADVGTWQDVTISNKYWKEAAAACMTPADSAKLDAYTKENVVGLILGDLEWTEFESLKVSGCKIGIEIVKGKRIEFAGSLYDVDVTDCGVGLVVDSNALDSRWGMVVAKSKIEGGIQNLSTAGGAVKICDVEIKGNCSGKILRDDESTLTNYKVDYKASYVKPVAKLYTTDLDVTGKQDVSAALQKVLDEAGKTGGVVYLPGGLYRMDQPVSVPAGVELRGASSVATRDQGGSYLGTVILCYYGDDATSKSTDKALITLAGKNAGLNGIRIYYPENGPYDSNLETTYTVRGQAEGVYVVNSAIAASGYGIDFRGCNKHFIKKVTTCCYYNTFLLGGRGGIVSGCLQNGTVICRSALPDRVQPLSEGAIFSDLFDPILRKTSLYIIVDNAEDELIYNTFCYGCASFVTCNNSQDVLLVNIGSDNIGKETAQTVMNSGSMTVINAMRYNGSSYSYASGELELYNRLTINKMTEETLVKD